MNLDLNPFLLSLCQCLCAFINMLIFLLKIACGDKMKTNVASSLDLPIKKINLNI